MARTALQFLRPYASRSFKPLANPEHARAYCAIQRRALHTASQDTHTGPTDVEKQKRLDQLKKIRSIGEYHPRLNYVAGVERLTVREFNIQYDGIEGTQTNVVSVLGRVRSIRLLGSKLMFIDLEREHQTVQAMVELKKLKGLDDSIVDSFKGFKSIVRKGDYISIRGSPTRTSTGQLSLLADEVPEILSPCLHHLPDKVENLETLARRPHIHQLTDPEPGDILQLRSVIYDRMRSYLVKNSFLEVETPTFDVEAGGAIARPFETVANEMSNMPIRLRIAPELNLKRLIVGGQDRVFEIGRVFRNEGVDNTHNPEFSTCEFYEVGATLPTLVERTEEMVHGLWEAVLSTRERYPSLSIPTGEDIDFTYPFAQLPFVPTIEKASGRKLPDLSSTTATTDVLAFYEELAIPVPPNATLPRLLDGLAENYIEPQCKSPTFITYHPEALSPLAKSFVDEASGQRVAARAELFIQGREYINAYEEENSPFEQRRKFMQQLEFHPEGDRAIDESYLEALEWGMPPTGGWGCGMDRLVMLFANKKRIADVLPFGTLRNVVSISKTK
ncbi:lysyl-tRNA synthetase [Polyplosphaeria fusca]|uniref:Lysyl-tRNA synthetase n=1 Tax=Polyplosphaeria fusca TaxID=682080 RepID=A0A9P4R556_9PLEO|nr:lysyl-tRNA synthetase [Polyplosphaeria fusca]